MILLLITFLLQLNNPLSGKWQLIVEGQNQNKDFTEFAEFKNDTVVFTQEFISKNSYKIDNNNLKVINDKKEKIIETQFRIDKDTLILIKNNKEKDKMYRISSPGKVNGIIGTWFGKTYKGVKTYFIFKADGKVIYKAIIDSKKYKYLNNNSSIKIYLRNKLEKINYEIKGDYLILKYEETGENFKYKRNNDF